MLLTRNSVELLAPVGTWDMLEAAIDAGADAVYLGGKRYNMRMHRTDTNFDDQGLARAIEYAHSRNTQLYVTVNNLISERELPGMRDYLKLLDQIKPDALIVQDLAILELAHELNFSVPLHASVMMNTHNELSIRSLQNYGITRVVAGREMTLAQLTLLKEKTGIEMEYFIHGDMCIAHSGQCIHSGVVFGQSSNRGRCLKPCRWPYQLIDSATGLPVAENDPGAFKLAMKDMCMYRNLPELIQAGVCSFKIEGRMRTADFVKRIVQVYRRAIDRYIADPMGYTVNEDDWQDLYENRSRDFSTCYALGYPGASSVGYTGEREPRFFSQAVKEAGMATAMVPAKNGNGTIPNQKLSLSVRVASLAAVTAACQNGANTIYIGGEAFKPDQPWHLPQIEEALAIAQKYHTKLIVSSPRVTMERESSELQQQFSQLANLPIHGLMVSNIGMLSLAKTMTTLPVHTDFSLNVFNHKCVQWLKTNGAAQAVISPEATYEEIRPLTENSPLPLELIVHGPLEAMILEHSIPSAVLAVDIESSPEFANRQYALLDTAGQQHAIRIDQYGRNHLLFAKDLCLLPYLPVLTGIASLRIEGQHYSPEAVGIITAVYRKELDALLADPANYQFDSSLLETLANAGSRPLGVAAFRYRVSR